MNRLKCVWVAVAAMGLGMASVWAGVPNLIHYQGRMVDGTNLVNASVQLELSLYDAPTGGILLYTDYNAAVPVVDGLYSTFLGDNTTVGVLQNALSSTSVWLQVVVNGTPLTPRERLAAVPYSRVVHGLAISERQSVTLLPVEGTNAMSPAARASVISGGNSHTVEDSWYSVIAGGQLNRMGLFADYNVISGGLTNLVATQVRFGAIGGGERNTLGESVRHGVIGGGSNNTVSASQSVIAGGESNQIETGTPFAAISGGRINRIASGGTRSVIAGGENNEVRASYSVIGGGSANRIESNAFYAVVDGGILNVVMSNSPYATIGGGIGNEVRLGSQAGVIGGGTLNRLGPGSTNSVIAGGANNTISNANSAAIGGGSAHFIASSANHSVIAGGQTHVIQAGSTHSFIGGGANHQIASQAPYAFIGGGLINQIGAGATNAVIIGGRLNYNAGSRSTIGGGFENVIDSDDIFSPLYLAGPKDSVIGGGRVNAISPNHVRAVIGGGELNRITNSLPDELEGFGVIGGGLGNIVGAHAATVPGGSINRAMGRYSFAAGRNARALHDNTFVFAGFNDKPSFTNDSMTARFENGYYFFTSANNGAQIPPNGTSWSAISDREAKENFAPVHTGAILDKIVAMPLTEWSYKEDPNKRRYIGPVAQDFHAAFGLGDNKTINTLDSDGVLFAAVQALAAQLSDIQRQQTKLESENAVLRQQVEALQNKLGEGH